MKNYLKWLILLAVAILFAVTNPAKSVYTDWLSAKVHQEISKEGVFTDFAGMFLPIDRIIDKHTTSRNFLFFSVFHTEVPDIGSATAVGILRQIIPISLDKNQKFSIYYNSRYGYSIVYPKDFVKAPPAGNGSGQQFYSPECGLTMSVFGCNNASEATIDDELLSAPEDLLYIYKKDNWAIISYIKDDTFFVEKEYCGSESINRLSISCPAEFKDKYDGLISFLVATFTPGNLNEAH
jgi:hypothetical protein